MYSKRVAHYQPRDATRHCGHPRVKSGTAGLVEMTSLASFREWEARISLSAAITLVLASLEASASMTMAR